jgi:hypothetical protein
VLAGIALGLATIASAAPGPSAVSAGGPYPDGAQGWDISWPQCGGAYPPVRNFGIVGVDGGHPFKGNPCLASEWGWAKSAPVAPSVYINLDYPNKYNGHADLTPYWYGANSAADSVHRALALGIVPSVWWLDVETSNCWNYDCTWGPFYTGSNAQVVQGALDYLHQQAYTVGIYSTPYQWGLLMGGYSPGAPVWVPDFNPDPPATYCSPSRSFGGGEVWLVQYTGGAYDANYSCPSRRGYYLVAGDGGVFPFGNAVGYGSTGNLRLNQPVVGMATAPRGGGYWLVAADGGIFPFGPNAGGYGSTGNLRLNQPVVGMASTPSGRGYWLVASDGGIFPFGDAGGYGSTGNLRLNQPIVAMASTPSGRGYWLVASDGGIFPFGDAGGYGSAGNIALRSPIVGMATTPSGRGYWLVAADGGIFPFGDAPGYGSAAWMPLSSPVRGMARTTTGQGYWLVTADGSVITFGDAVTSGGLNGQALARPVLGISLNP